MTKNYWVKAAINRKNSSTRDILSEANSAGFQDGLIDALALEGNDVEKILLNKLLSEYLYNYRQLHRELNPLDDKAPQKSHPTKLKTAI